MKMIQIALVMLAFSTPCSSVVAASTPGQIIGWGDNNSWGIATGDPTLPPPRPVTIAGQALSNAVAVSAGRTLSLAIKSDGTIAGWGNTSVPVGLSNVVAIAAGAEHSLALKNDGTVVAWGNDHLGQATVPSGLSNVVAIGTGMYSSLAVKSDGTVVGWGETIPEPPGLSNVIAVAGQPGRNGPNLALRKDGMVVGITSLGIRPVVGLSNAVAIAAGGDHNLALKSDGTVFGWGDNVVGEATGISTTNSPYHASGPVTIGGQVLSNVVAIAAGNRYSLALKRDGTVVFWGWSPYHRMDVPAGLSNVVAISAGQDFCLAITTNSSAFAVRK